MSKPHKNEFVPYELVSRGFEAVYTGGQNITADDHSDESLWSYSRDGAGNVYMKYSCWGFAHPSEESWNDEIFYINSMQEQLGSLDNAARRIRSQIASLQCCDSGFPVTVDEILNAIGTGFLPQTAFHAGCWLSMATRSTQPRQAESMGIIELILQAYLNGRSQDALIDEYSCAKGFIRRLYQWLGPADNLSDLQKLMFDRLLLPFDFLTSRTEDRLSVHKACFESGGRGVEIDGQISALSGLPEIHANYKKEFQENLISIDDAQKRELYSVCGAMTHGLHGLSDCHHSTYRWIESWIHSIGKLSLQIPTRAAGVEAKRLGRLLFGYALGLDRWLQDIPMQFLLLDLGYVDLKFDPKNEILRVYAYLGDKNSIKEWLAACLWYTLVLERPASIYDWGYRHKELVDEAQAKGISVRDWMNSHLGVKYK